METILRGLNSWYKLDEWPTNSTFSNATAIAQPGVMTDNASEKASKLDEKKLPRPPV